MLPWSGSGRQSSYEFAEATCSLYLANLRATSRFLGRFPPLLYIKLPLDIMTTIRSLPRELRQQILFDAFAAAEYDDQAHNRKLRRISMIVLCGDLQKSFSAAQWAKLSHAFQSYWEQLRSIRCGKNSSRLGPDFPMPLTVAPAIESLVHSLTGALRHDKVIMEDLHYVLNTWVSLHERSVVSHQTYKQAGRCKCRGRPL